MMELLTRVVAISKASNKHFFGDLFHIGDSNGINAKLAFRINEQL